MAANTEMATMTTRPNRNRYSNMTELEIISSMNDRDLTRNARRGGIDSIYEIGYRLNAAAGLSTPADWIIPDPELDIGV